MLSVGCFIDKIQLINLLIFSISLRMFTSIHNWVSYNTSITYIISTHFLWWEHLRYILFVTFKYTNMVLLTTVTILSIIPPEVILSSYNWKFVSSDGNLLIFPYSPAPGKHHSIIISMILNF